MDDILKAIAKVQFRNAFAKWEQDTKDLEYRYNAVVTLYYKAKEDGDEEKQSYYAKLAKETFLKNLELDLEMLERIEFMLGLFPEKVGA